MSVKTIQAATTANVASANTNTTVFPASTSAMNGRCVYNDSTAVMYLKFGTTASASSYTVQIAAGGYFEFPTPVYAGQCDGIWASANGNARTTSW